MALPKFRIIKPWLRVEATIIAGNTTMVGLGYREIWDYILNPAKEFKATTVPYHGR